jgi:hypothetical protein
MNDPARSEALGGRLSSAEWLVVAIASWLAFVILWTYALDLLGLGLAPLTSVAAATLTAGAMAGRLSRLVVWRFTETVLVVIVVAGTFGLLCWITWPSLLPPGSGPDLTHHLLLIDYFQRHGTLVHDSNAGGLLGEMADYTPGLHILAFVAGRLAGTDPFFTVHPLVAMSVALKLGIFGLIVVRLFDGDRVRVPAAIVAVLCVGHAASYAVGSFLQDSFLAQVVSELFAILAWWALCWWQQSSSTAALIVFAVAGSAVFLTWPVWLGPLVLSLVVLVLVQSNLGASDRARHVLLALAPIAVVALVHAAGRTSWLSILGTSGAVTQPSPAVLGWWLPVMAVIGLAPAFLEPRARPVIVLIGALAGQALALWAVARGRHAATPYMAIKMIYLGLYPAIASAVMGIVAVARATERIGGSIRRPTFAPVILWIVVAVLGVATLRRDRIPRPTPVVSNDLFEIGQWARAHVPIECVDYLVGNDYTAYWLHLAVLGNARASARSGNDDTYATQTSFARWLDPAAPGRVRYAIADLAIVPAQIRNDVEILTQVGQIAVIERRGDTTPCP